MFAVKAFIACSERQASDYFDKEARYRISLSLLNKLNQCTHSEFLPQYYGTVRFEHLHENMLSLHLTRQLYYLHAQSKRDG